ncbi:hypothetical protein O181_105344 [Austropuccinia psidii MF-1]|uniref:Uncharacterized protein n=1 Tax=Austropuccinia psidii MF-1 TaxID=1389203 RepID=A0A9Q3JPZ0_9BASI|nr:hypothetical protein [Austropuccinia psidii MF-1]
MKKEGMINIVTEYTLKTHQPQIFPRLPRDCLLTSTMCVGSMKNAITAKKFGRVSPEQDPEDESIGDNGMDYGKSIILEYSDEYESNNDVGNTQYKSKAAKDRKGKQKANEEDFEADNMELNEEYGRETFAGGLTEEEWNAWQ